MSVHIARAKLAGRILRFVPFLRTAALNGSVVRGEETSQSDIDILIIGKSGRLYTCRFFATLLIHLTGRRRYGRKIAGRICLNCYLGDDNPDITPRNKKSTAKVVRAYKYMIPLVDDGSSQKFFKTNSWFNNYKVVGHSHSQLLKDKIFNHFPLQPKRSFGWLLEGRFGDMLEKKLMAYQQKRIFSFRKEGDELYANEEEIRLHPRARKKLASKRFG